MAVFLKLEAIAHRYGSVEVLGDINLTIERGEQLALVGSNGAGKSTLAKHMNGLLEPCFGKVFFKGRDLRSMNAAEIARSIGFVFQNPDDQIFKSRIYEEVGVGVKYQGMREEKRMRRRIEQALALVGLAGLGESHPYDLSFARRKMIAIASVLAVDPELFIFDEPTLGQGSKGLNLFAELLDCLRHAGKTVVIISHDLDFLLDHVDRFVVLEAGKVAVDASAADLFYHWPYSAPTLIPPQVVQLTRQLDLNLPILRQNEFVLELQRLKAKASPERDGAL